MSETKRTELTPTGGVMPKSEGTFTEQWFTEELHLQVGLFQLRFDGGWHCSVAGESCRQILGCEQEKFWEQLQKLNVHTSYHGAATTVASLLRGIEASHESLAFIGICPCGAKGSRYIKGTLSVHVGQDGKLSVLGQLADVTELRERDVQAQIKAEELRTTMAQAGEHVSYYDIERRTLTMSPATADSFDITPVLENYPECYLEHPPAGTTPGMMEKLRLFFEQIRRGDPKGYYEYSTVSADGHRVWMRREFQTIFDEQGRPVRAVITSKNITTQYHQLIQNESERLGLIKIAHLTFQEILSCNLTRGSYSLLQGMPTTPQDLSLDELYEKCLLTIAPEDREAFRRNFFRSYQLEALQEGKSRFTLIYRRRSREGQWHWVETSSVVYTNPANDDILSFTVSRSMDEEKAREDLQRRLMTDELTGLYTREGFFAKAKERIESETEPLDIVRLNVCNFKLVNELWGTETGDRLLRAIGTALQELGREYGFIAGRFSADQFFLCIRREDFEKIRFSAKVTAEWLGTDVVLSYGVYPADREHSVSTMCDRANMAIAAREKNASGSVSYYNDTFRQKMLQEREIESEMEKALEERQFCIHVQPKFDVATDQIVGGEALVRWMHPKKGMIPPGAFISLFEKNGFIRALDYYVWEESCRLLAELKDRGLPVAPISVNVSRLHFYSGELQQKLTKLLEKYQLSAKDLELEITESIYEGNPESIVAQCRALQTLGFRIAMDDFGSGFSSLNMLKQMPLDIIKMDLKFLADDAKGEQSMKGRDILRTQIELAHTIGLDVVVEGLEIREQRDFIREIGNCAVQGYYYAKPMPKHEFLELLRSGSMERGDVSSSGVAARLRRERLRREQLQPQLELIEAAEHIFGYLPLEKEAVLPLRLAKALRCPQRVSNLTEHLIEAGSITPASVPQCRKLVEAVERGERYGAAIVEYVDSEGNIRPYWVRFGTVLDFEDQPLIAMLSAADFGDISEQVEALMASRQTQAESENLLLKGQMKETQQIFRIVSDHSNRILYLYDLASGTTRPWDEEQAKKDILAHLYTGTYTEENMERNQAILSENKDEIKRFFTGIHSGIPSGELVLHVKLLDGTPAWYHLQYSSIFSHGKPVSAVISAKDITEEKTAQLSLLTRSERDGLTGVYNRDTAERLIRKELETNLSPGIFVVLDLDRLKQINDGYGHEQGDKAIVSVAEMLKTHFRTDDIIGRFGGDEFVIYMPGAANNKEVISGTIADLMRKLSALSVGENGEMAITCSIGCAVVEEGGASFSAVFKQADKALYHVKKSGRNNFAFYTPEMEDANFVFRLDRLFSLDHAKRYESGEVQQLITTLCDIYPLVIAFNLTQNTYHMMKEVKNGIFRQRDTFGRMDDIVGFSVKNMPPEDGERFLKAVSREALIEADARGEKHVSVRFMSKDIHGVYRLAECNSILYRSEQGELCEFALIRWV